MATLPVSYTTVENVQKIVSRIGSVTTLSSADTAYHIGRAQAYIDGFLSRKYTLPFSQQIPLLQTLCDDMSVYYILRRFFVDAGGGEKNQWIESFKKNVDETLEAVIEDKIFLVTNSGGQIGGKSEMQPWSSTTLYKPTFDHRHFTKQRIDEDRIEDEENEDD